MAATKIEEQNNFNAIIEAVGSNGYFQKRFNLIFNVLYIFLISMSHLNLIISLAVPNHWCHVPGRENMNYTLEEWKTLTIPMERNAYGNLDFSKCKRYEIISGSVIQLRSNNKTIECNNGWEFDHTWYDLTASMQNEWVCDKAMIPTNTLAADRAGEVFGAIILSQLADNFGRMPIIFISMVIIIIGRMLSVVTYTWVILFYIAAFIGSLSVSSAFYSPIIISIEISSPSNRAFIKMLGTFFITIGLVITPFFMWILRDWVYFMIVTTLPSALCILAYPWVIESPRWLITKGKIKQCVLQLQKIATTNKRELPSNFEKQLTVIQTEQGDTKVYTIFDLFSSWRLAKNTIIMVYCYTVLHMMYSGLTISIGYRNTNPFLQHALQAAISLPGLVISKYICDNFGRRWVTFYGFFLSTIGCICTIFLVEDVWMESIMCIVIKFCISLMSFSTSLQLLEMYPTCIRQTGMSVGSIAGGALSIFSPYVIALGTTISPTIPFIIFAVLSLLATIFCIFLPETHDQLLPETLQDAAMFGADQNFWGKTKSSKCI